MANIKDITGQVFGKLTVVSLLPARTKSKGGHAQWRCRCACGNWVPHVDGTSLRRGKTKSCGCHKIESSIKHGCRKGGHKGEHYNRWSSIKQRTSNPKNKNWSRYGGRGIEMHEPWFDSFILFKKWLDDNLGPCPEGCTLDRIDNDGNYEPNNLRWATAEQQRRNQ